MITFVPACSPSSDSGSDHTSVVSATSIQDQSVILKGKKVLYVNSYHPGLPWSDGIEAGLKSVLDPSGVDYQVCYMDTKRNQGKDFAIKAAREVMEILQSFQPDVLITSDDNAFLYVVQEHCKDSNLPVIFCGVNWGIRKYGGPYSNTAGMVEVVLYDKSIQTVMPYAKGGRIGFLTEDTYSEHSNANSLAEHVGVNTHKIAYVKDFQEWQKKFVEMQDEVDILILGVMGSFIDWNDQEQRKAVMDFALENTRIPTITDHVWMVEFALLSYGKIPEEQGRFAASSALKVLQGAPVSDIGVVKNMEGELAINIKLADKLGILFSPWILKNAKVFN